MSWITGIIFFVSFLFGILTYIISTTPHVPGWLAGVTGALMILMLILGGCALVSDLDDKVEDFSDGR